MDGDENIQPDDNSFANLMNAFDKPGAEEEVEEFEPEEGEQEEDQDEPAEEEEKDEPEAGDAFTIKHDGKEVTLSKDEAKEMILPFLTLSSSSDLCMDDGWKIGKFDMFCIDFIGWQI